MGDFSCQTCLALWAQYQAAEKADAGTANAREAKQTQLEALTEAVRIHEVMAHLKSVRAARASVRV